jgi:hypothetical protein
MSTEKYNLLIVILQIVALLVQSVSLVFLIIYVRKTAQMAEATSKSVEMTQEMVSTARLSAEATIRSAKAAEDSVQELRETRERESVPYVVAYFDASLETFLIYLVIKNIGKTFANKVKLDFEPPIQNSTEGINISEIPIIKDGIGSIPPGYEIRTLFDSALSYFGKDGLPLSYKVRISYSGGLRDHLRSYDQMLDLGAFKDLSDIHQRGFNDLVKQVEDLAKNQAETNKSLHNLVRSIEKGIWLRNQDFIVRDGGLQNNSWPFQVLAKLNEFRDIWMSMRESEENINLPSSGIQAKCLLIKEQVLALFANRPVDTSKGIIAELRIIAAKIAELGRMRFYIDGGRSEEKFTSFAEGIIDKIADVEQILLSNDREPETT